MKSHEIEELTEKFADWIVRIIMKRIWKFNVSQRLNVDCIVLQTKHFKETEPSTPTLSMREQFQILSREKQPKSRIP